MNTKIQKLELRIKKLKQRIKELSKKNEMQKQKSRIAFIKQHKYSKTKFAELLGVSRMTIHRDFLYIKKSGD